MKKFMFSAIAMIAFVGSGMANTVEIQNLESSLPPRDCYKEGTDARDAAYAATGNMNTANDIGLGAMADCLEATTPKKLVRSIGQ
jgi:hypothetical protein